MPGLASRLHTFVVVLQLACLEALVGTRLHPTEEGHLQDLAMDEVLIVILLRLDLVQCPVGARGLLDIDAWEDAMVCLENGGAPILDPKLKGVGLCASEQKDIVVFDVPLPCLDQDHGFPDPRNLAHTGVCKARLSHKSLEPDELTIKCNHALQHASNSKEKR